MRWLPIGAVLIFGTAILVAAPVHAVSRVAINRSIERGIAALRGFQNPGGTWSFAADDAGATALAGLTLLECGVKSDDLAIGKAAAVIRRMVPNLSQTYSIALSILFLDRLGDPADEPLIQTLGVRLVYGQQPDGSFGYGCSRAPAEAEIATLLAQVGKNGENEKTDDPVVKLRKTFEARAGQSMPTGPGNVAAQMIVDNSNTQFAVLGMWVARRHGLPLDPSLKAVEMRFRRSQNNDGGWSYTVGFGGSTPTMTAAGLIALAIGNGASVNLAKTGRAPAAVIPLNKDAGLNAGLAALSSAIGNPVGERAMGIPGAVPIAGGKSYYFLWSLERVCMALGLETLGKKNWYQWGAEILLVSQRPGGAWEGEYAQGGVDTCFALLFLVRSNLAKDLTTSLRGMLRDAGHVTLKAGGVGGEGLKGRSLKPGIESSVELPDNLTKPTRPNTSETTRDDKPSISPDSDAGRLVAELVGAPANRLEVVLDRLRDAKGVANTEALAAAIPQLPRDARKKARDALAERLSRMRAASLANYLKDEDAEIRRAAALGLAMKESKEHVPDIINLLRDPEEIVVLGAHAALTDLTSKDFGPVKGATPGEKDRAVAAWRAWWKKNKRE